eukprot:Pompholyxophrys_sp_v1_NODE_7_length_5994_cov_24.204748.p6 type:complete len:112 gc:universal NODE_7_length_5994_cov_24.204748:5130-5465(+)
MPVQCQSPLRLCHTIIPQHWSEYPTPSPTPTNLATVPKHNLCKHLHPPLKPSTLCPWITNTPKSILAVQTNIIHIHIHTAHLLQPHRSIRVKINCHKKTHRTQIIPQCPRL